MGITFDILTGWGQAGQCLPGQGAGWQDSTDSGGDQLTKRQVVWDRFQHGFDREKLNLKTSTRIEIYLDLFFKYIC